MNNLLQLKGRLNSEKSPAGFGSPKLPGTGYVETTHLESLLRNIIELKEYWVKEDVINGALVSVYYTKVAAKSNRIKELLSKGSKKAPTSVVGARFTSSGEAKHIITHYVSLDVLDETMQRLQICIDILNNDYNGKITASDLEASNFSATSIKRTPFFQTIVDSFYVEKFDVLIDDTSLESDSIVTLFKTDVKTKDLLESIGISLLTSRIIDDTTILLRPDELELLKSKAPFLISMAVTDITTLPKDFFDFYEYESLSIPSPKNEPIIGVIDTLFDTNVYFSEWVDFTNMVPDDITPTANDYLHGTGVSSLIVDGPTLNPKLDDGCGRFKVRHFGVAVGNRFSSFSILRAINDIIIQNRDIKVWNLSLGSSLETNPNFISPEAAILDTIQFKNDVIFIIAGTNNDAKKTQEKRVGAPADSINSLVVNSVNSENKPASYSRKGPVLSFFTKPDISCFGGDIDESIRVFRNKDNLVRGTSYAAPWIARKVAYLIHILGLSREVAKALIIHSATDWSGTTHDSHYLGYGVVPRKIDDVIKCADDEIQFFISGVSEEYHTYTYNLPVPIEKAKYPFVAKATLCYFPACSRNQGVDYTNTELDISFGRLQLDKKTNRDRIISINKNEQSSEAGYKTWEKVAREMFRKWDNIKHISEKFTGRNRAKEVYGAGNWGISIRSKERLEEKFGTDLKFGIVISLKEINGKNRIDDFIKMCSARGWLVNQIDVQNRIDIYTIAEQDIEFDE